MADTFDPYFLQPVSEAEAGFWLSTLEQADRDMMSDLGFVGMLDGGLVTQHGPGDLTVDISAGGGYDPFGQRARWGATQRIDCVEDMNGSDCSVQTVGNKRWVMLCARFKRDLQDSRTDGNGIPVFYSLLESFEILVVAGAEVSAGSFDAGDKPALRSDSICLCDIDLAFGQTQILTANIDDDRRQSILVTGSLQTDFIDHYTGVTFQHQSADIIVNTLNAWADGTVLSGVWPQGVQDVLAAIVDGLRATANPAGVKKIGSGTITGQAIDGSIGSYQLTSPATLEVALKKIVGGLNSLGSAFGTAGGISTTALAAWLDATTNPGTTVQAQLGKIVSDLIRTNTGTSGSNKIGVGVPGGTPHLSAGPLQAAIDYIDANTPWRDVAGTWTKKQTYSLGLDDTADIAHARVPVATWKLIRESVTGQGAVKYREFVGLNGDKVRTWNANWDNAAAKWVKDVPTTQKSIKEHVFLASGKIILAHYPAASASPFNDSEFVAATSGYIEILPNVGSVSIVPTGEIVSGPITGHFRLLEDPCRSHYSLDFRFYVPFRARLTNGGPVVTISNVSLTGCGGLSNGAGGGGGVVATSADGFEVQVNVTAIGTSAGILNISFDYSAV